VTVRTSPCIAALGSIGPTSMERTRWDSGSSCGVRERIGMEVVDMSSLLWTIFAIIGIIVVIGWVLGR
jgi:hypothetical protein